MEWEKIFEFDAVVAYTNDTMSTTKNPRTYAGVFRLSYLRAVALKRLYTSANPWINDLIRRRCPS